MEANYIISVRTLKDRNVLHLFINTFIKTTLFIQIRDDALVKIESKIDKAYGNHLCNISLQ